MSGEQRAVGGDQGVVESANKVEKRPQSFDGRIHRASLEVDT